MNNKQLNTYFATLGKVRESYPLRKCTTYRIGGIADWVIEPDSLEHLMELLSFIKEHAIPYLLLGNGSNVLIHDRPFHGVVVHTGHLLSGFEFDENGILTAQAGCSLILLASKAMEHSLSGLEFASGIPGTVGGGLYMNAGAYKASLSDILIEVLVYDFHQTKWIAKEKLDYAYRHSAFQKHKDWIILAARFALHAKNSSEIGVVMERRRNRRLETQPLEMPSAGSVFRNPENGFAWQIIDDLGFRGKRRGGASVSKKHCNFIVNENGKASAHDVDSLIRTIQKKALAKTGIPLVLELERINWPKHEK
jgi:UDP-N-acetylmuramate dehydrogenase